MPADVRINEVTTDVNVTDSSALLTPPVLEKIIQAVLKRLEEQKRSEHDKAKDEKMGSAREQEKAK